MHVLTGRDLHGHKRALVGGVRHERVDELLRFELVRERGIGELAAVDGARKRKPEGALAFSLDLCIRFRHLHLAARRRVARRFLEVEAQRQGSVWTREQHTKQK